MFTIGSAMPTAACPSCGRISARTHSGYRRRLADLPISGRPVQINVGVRRFRCDDPGCGAATFAEQIPSLRTVERYAAQLRERTDPPSTAPTPPKPRRVAGWIMSDPDHLAAGAAVPLKCILARCPELEATRRHVGSFANMIQNLAGDRLPGWIDAVRADGLPALHSFATSLTRDRDAVTAVLTLPWSSGPMEGTVNRLNDQEKHVWPRQPRPTPSTALDHLKATRSAPDPAGDSAPRQDLSVATGMEQTGRLPGGRAGGIVWRLRDDGLASTPLRARLPREEYALSAAAAPGRVRWAGGP